VPVAADLLKKSRKFQGRLVETGRALPARTLTYVRAMPRRNQAVAALVAFLLIGGLTLLGSGGVFSLPGGGGGSSGPPPVYITWGQQVDLNAVGYEPSIAVDSNGVMYMTAHKNLDDRSTWPYLASWFLVSKDGGNSWVSPTDPFPLGAKWKIYLGDEGDIAIDGRDFVYFVDTYLLDNHLHVWANGGEWQYSLRVQKTLGVDDRPWITAQGDGILHYLGNNAASVGGGRIWYYRSDNGGRTWTAGDPVPGNGWAQLEAERTGQAAYIISESAPDAPADILVYRSENEGNAWDWSNPVVIGHRDGPGRQFPWIVAGQNGMVYALWNDATNGTENGTRIFMGVSDDYAKTWNVSEITPFEAFIDYPTITVGPDNTVGVAFYGTTDLPISSNSTWYLYGAMQRNVPFGPVKLNFSIASDEPLYQGADLHALHDFFEIVVAPDFTLNVAYMHYVGPCNGCGRLYFIKGELPARPGIG
jgi:hypothetical protein